LSKKQIANKHLYILIIMYSVIIGLFLLINSTSFFIVFVPYIGIFLFMVFSIIIIISTILDIKKKSQNTKASSIAYAILPGLSTIFTIAMLINNFYDSHGNFVNIYAYLVFFFVTISCSMLLFFKGIKKMATKIILGIIYSIALLPIVLFLVFIAISPPSAPNIETVQFEISPNEQYVAKLGVATQDCLNDGILIVITRQPATINLLVAELRRNTSMRYLYNDNLADFCDTTLHWESDYRLIVDLDTPLIFRFDGQNWIRE